MFLQNTFTGGNYRLLDRAGDWIGETSMREVADRVQTVSRQPSVLPYMTGA